MPIGRLFRRAEERGRPDLPLLSVYRDLGVVLREGREDNFNRPGHDLAAYRVVRRGDLVLNKMKTWQGSLGVSDHHGIVSPAYYVCRQLGLGDLRFIHHLLRSGPLVAEYGARSKGIRPSQWDLPWDEFKTIHVCLPLLAEQRAIADFLDAETSRIDALITKKRRLIELIAARHATWVREQLQGPHDVLPLKRRWRVVDCKHRTPIYTGDGHPVMSPGDIAPGRLDLNMAHRFVGEIDFLDLTEGGRRPHRDNIIYSRNASIGIAAYVDTDEPFCMGQDVCLITSADQSQLYLTYALNSIGVDQLDAEKLGTTFSRINVAQIAELRIPVPPPREQHMLARRFDRASRRVAGLVSRLTRQLELLAEHRQALITAAVTGELDVAREIAEEAS
ncbi:hypothetical protein BH24ACT7_BH24ACT7_14710 [soil metagenome]